MSDRDNNHVSGRTKARRDDRNLTDAQTRRAKELRDQGRTFDDIDVILCVEAGTTLADHGSWRDTNSASGNAVLNIDPEDRDSFRANHCLPGEAIRPAFKRHLSEHAQLCAWADQTGFPGFSTFTPEPVQF